MAKTNNIGGKTGSKALDYTKHAKAGGATPKSAPTTKFKGHKGK